MLRPAALAASAALGVSVALPATAQDPVQPPEVAAIVQDAVRICDGEVTVSDKGVAQRDLNGDGTLDWVIDTGAFSCTTSYGTYCGTAGCGVETLIDGVQGSLLLHGWDTLTEGGVTYLTAPDRSGGTARFLWTGSDWQQL